MIDLDRMRPLPSALLKGIYAAYAVGIGVFSLAAAVSSIFDICADIGSMFTICDIKIEPAELGMLGLALIAPVAPFVRNVSLPWGGGWSWPEGNPQRIMSTAREGAIEATERIGDLNLDDLIIGNPEPEDPHG